MRAWPSGIGPTSSGTSPLAAYNALFSTNTTGSGSRMADFSKP
ncbi:Uncharacterised protein [Bordetella pertussis]|nr:Uncharacterised protein [Bordetella pertussis]